MLVKIRQELALTRYYYAYRLHYIIQGKLNNRMEMIGVLSVNRIE